MSENEFWDNGYIKFFFRNYLRQVSFLTIRYVSRVVLTQKFEFFSLNHPRHILKGHIHSLKFIIICRPICVSGHKDIVIECFKLNYVLSCRLL